MIEFKLANKIDTCVKTTRNTPRIALSFNLTIPEAESNAGLYLLMNRLLLKGTTKYSSEELSAILEENAIDLFTEMKYDYLRFRFVSLNEDFELALSIMADIILNSTFEDFEKERIQLKGELTAELDSAKTKVTDLFTKNIYKDHFYGHSCTKTLEEIDKCTFEDIKKAYFNILNNSEKKIAVVGDIDNNKASELLNKYLCDIPAPQESGSKIPAPNRVIQDRVELIKDDAQQAQIIQGWQTATYDSDDSPKLMLLNVILGASGLSSRLFLELREKKGLAYTVRTSYELHSKSAVFSIYIGTEPGNIKTSIDGFNIEIEKIKNELISEEELHNAKNNLIGRQQFITETNSQQANLMAYYAITGRPFDYQQNLIKKLQAVTAEELKECANKYFTDDYVIAIIRP